ncbi:hypothetical protein [Amycolatopsis sp. NPDC051102]|uniref:hypothetical protein n=1 Tax=Amycolatopsis sp. NPDC051102 TaxID=3155163 RepID=UPI003432CB59
MTTVAGRHDTVLLMIGHGEATLAATDRRVTVVEGQLSQLCDYSADPVLHLPRR